MTEKTMQELLDQYDEAVSSLEVGETIEGTIHSLSSELAVIALDHMFDGVVRLTEIEEEKREVGQKMVFIIRKIDDEEGQVILSRSDALQNEILETLDQVFEKEGSIEVVAKEVIKGGLRVEYKGYRGFMPFSQIDISYVEEPEKWIGKNLEVRIIKWEEDDKNLVVSRRTLLEEKRAKSEEAFYEALEVDRVFEGRVHKIFKAGALIDLGSAFGYLHINDASWTRIKDMEEVISPGDEIKVQVKSFDIKEKRISLSLKDISVNPWQIVREDYSIGDIVYGKILKDVGSGLLIELETGIVGYIHKSQMVGVKWQLDQEIAVEIETIDEEAQRMGLKYFDENAVADDFEQEEEENTTLGDLFGDLFDKID
jgi:small subunit ribosomal protein S1